MIISPALSNLSHVALQVHWCKGAKGCAPVPLTLTMPRVVPPTSPMNKFVLEGLPAFDLDSLQSLGFAFDEL